MLIILQTDSPIPSVLDNPHLKNKYNSNPLTRKTKEETVGDQVLDNNDKTIVTETKMTHMELNNRCREQIDKV
jgi:hypothetical protein